MNKKGLKYEQEIKKLKGLRAKANTGAKEWKNKYKLAMREICSCYGVSEKTIYRDMRKRRPGFRKHRSDIKEITNLEKKIILEVMKSGKTQGEARKIAGKRTGKRISSGLVRRIKINGNEDDKSVFGKSFIKFIHKYFELDLIASSSLDIKLGNYKFEICKEDIEDIVLILKNAYNRFIFGEKNKIPLDKDQINERKLMHLFEQQIQIASETGNIKDIEMLTKIYERMKPDINVDVNIKILEQVCKELKPEITLTDIISLLKKYNK